MAQTPGVKLRLRHLNGTPRRPPPDLSETPDDQLIQKNLLPLKNNKSKLVAQKLYYEKHPEHQSPLTKEEKGPVHERLGVKQIRLKRLMPLGTNTSSVLPRRKLFRHPNQQHRFRWQNNPKHFKQFKMQRAYSAQSRLQKIKGYQSNTPIKLRRLNTIAPATNFTVQVKNPNYMPQVTNGQMLSFQNNIPKFKMILNPEIQAEIHEIQEDSAGSAGSLPPLTRITPVVTNLTTSARFAML